MSSNSIYELDAGIDVTEQLGEDDIALCLDAIREYDPKMDVVSKIIRSMEISSIIDVHLQDGAVWRLSYHPVGLSVDLVALGSTHLSGPLTAAIACAYTPVIQKQCVNKSTACIVPDVDCGEGFRQLQYLEDIIETDEFYSDPNTQWQPTNCSGSRYRPRHCETHSGGCALMRRKIT